MCMQQQVQLGNTAFEWLGCLALALSVWGTAVLRSAACSSCCRSVRSTEAQLPHTHYRLQQRPSLVATHTVLPSQPACSPCLPAAPALAALLLACCAVLHTHLQLRHR